MNTPVYAGLIIYKIIVWVYTHDVLSYRLKKDLGHITANKSVEKKKAREYKFEYNICQVGAFCYNLLVYKVFKQSMLPP